MVNRPQDIGDEFEAEFAERHGLRRVPGSGAQWHSKLDAHGKGVRWSLKATKYAGYTISEHDLGELLLAHAPGQDESMRMMAIKVNANSDNPVVIVAMLEDDFEAIATEQRQLVLESKTDAKIRLASVPELLRDEED